MVNYFGVIYMEIGNLIQEFRRRRGITQAELAERIGVATITIRQYENNKRRPRLEQLRLIAKVLGVDWTDLVPEEEQPQTVVDHMKEKLNNGAPFQKMTDAEMYRAGVLTFKADDDRIAYFYSLLNIDGKLAASKYFFQHLDRDAMGTVADYVQHLSEIPQYQRHDTKQSPPDGTDTTPPGEKPSEGG